MNSLPLMVALPLGALCGAIVLCDLRMLRIPDWITLSLLALFAAWIAADFGAIQILPRLVVASIAFCVCFGLFAARLMGGGDTKVIPALALFIPPEHLSSIMLLFSASLLASILAILSVRQWIVDTRIGWPVVRSQKIPMGLAIGMTGIFAIGLG
ncbi:A24 family peptidase [Litoreibacter ponti]|uniref:A24 family peptidase n=1 Tax=Litoreibacter ponti TaxID=1510457 RepID=UPI000D2F6904|nr:prepilin peptidase [Litoreibacter ponti]